ncbi:MAG TPA: histidine kinase [Opitutaceae bacterium]|nr:histidine kinase [Opitutaceae bacterium]
MPFPRPLLRLATAFCLGCGAIRAAEQATPNPRLTGTPFLQVWRTEDFGGSPVNWRVLQHPNGLIYVGNNFGVLQFDGATWRMIPMPREGAARALMVDAAGRLWAAGNGDIALLEVDASGVARLVDQTPRLPRADRVFGMINRASLTADGVYLSGDRRIFLFRPDGAVQVWRTEGDFSATWVIDGAVHVARDGRDLLRLEANGGTQVLASFNDPDAPLLRTYAAGRVGNERVLLARNGAVRWPENTTATEPLSAGAVAAFRNENARAALFLEDGRYLIGTVRGALLLNRQGELEQRFDTTHGLPVETINGFCEDRDGGAWLALQNGVARLQLDSPFAVHGQPQGLDAGPRRLTRWNDRLYVAHGSGVAWRDAADGKFHEVPGVRGGANRPIVVNERLLISTTGGIKEILADGSAKSWSRANTLALLASQRSPGWLFSGDSDGLWLVAPTADGWRVEGRLKNLPANVVQIHDSNDGFVWIVGSQGEIWRVDFRRGLQLDAPTELFEAERGVPPARRRDHVQVFSLGPDVIAAGKKWLVRFDPVRGRFAPASAALGGITGADAFDLADSAEGWLHVDDPQSSVLRVTWHAESEKPAWQIEPFHAAALDGLILNSIFHEKETRTLWIAGQGSLVSMDLSWRPRRDAAPLHALVRRVEAREGGVVFGGDGPVPTVLQLAANQNALRFEFAAPAFAPDHQGRIRVQYRTRIEGVDHGWTGWSAETYRDVTNLPYRQIKFQVQARTPDGRVSAENTLALALAAPWWLSRWSFGAYALVAIGGVTGLVRLRTREQRRRADRLEAVVSARTAELAEKNATLASQNVALERLRHLETQEKMAARLAEEKARLEVLRYQLNPHFLFNALTSICAQLPPTSGGARSTIERLTDFCQLTLFRPDGDAHPTLGDELKMLGAYLDIEQTRWGELLTVEIDCDPDLHSVQLPPLLLLPLVENALKYGRATSAGAMTIRLRAHRDEGAAIVLCVANTGEWVKDAERVAVPSLSIGLENLRERLRRYYPGTHAITTEAQDGWVAVTLRLTPMGSRTPAAPRTIATVI